MGIQSSRIWLSDKDHKEIYLNGKYHDKMYIGNTLVWQKIREAINFASTSTVWKAFYSGTLEKYYIFNADKKTYDNGWPYALDTVIIARGNITDGFEAQMEVNGVKGRIYDLIQHDGVIYLTGPRRPKEEGQTEQYNDGATGFYVNKISQDGTSVESFLLEQKDTSRGQGMEYCFYVGNAAGKLYFARRHSPPLVLFSFDIASNEFELIADELSNTELATTWVENQLYAKDSEGNYYHVRTEMYIVDGCVVIFADGAFTAKASYNGVTYTKPTTQHVGVIKLNSIEEYGEIFKNIIEFSGTATDVIQTQIGTGEYANLVYSADISGYLISNAIVTKLAEAKVYFSGSTTQIKDGHLVGASSKYAYFFSNECSFRYSPSDDSVIPMKGSGNYNRFGPGYDYWKSDEYSEGYAVLFGEDELQFIVDGEDCEWINSSATYSTLATTVYEVKSSKNAYFRYNTLTQTNKLYLCNFNKHTYSEVST
jgi:hypothetical protein